uniref:Uncharacterized protein n=1 Tax=Glossina austeni TaxID=7395 RepID=A0A1A9V2P0_GLOAU
MKPVIIVANQLLHGWERRKGDDLPIKYANAPNTGSKVDIKLTIVRTGSMHCKSTAKTKSLPRRQSTGTSTNRHPSQVMSSVSEKTSIFFKCSTHRNTCGNGGFTMVSCKYSATILCGDKTLTDKQTRSKGIVSSSGVIASGKHSNMQNGIKRKQKPKKM